MESSEDRLGRRLRKTHKIKDDKKAVGEVFNIFGDYYGEKAEQSKKKANRALVMVILAFALVFFVGFSML